ncbi:MAG: hypothetical protein DLM72_03565 [Candidatus Nitrosopolaris wilkensis]|nr:MAG: hypothetical protein DLM72_03565 [Candidatus Nitrosopolaris wilkensis]
MDEQQLPQERNEKNNNRNSPNTEFSFKYTELGGTSNRYLIVSYNSKTNIITSSTDVSGSNTTQKQPSESDEQELKEVVRANEFFKTKTDYPPEKEDENLVAHTLTITMGDNIHTTGWTGASKDIPESIIKIVNGIKKIVSKEKIV